MSRIENSRALTPEILVDEYLLPLQSSSGLTAETALGHAYDLGRQALARRQSLLDIVTMHHTALDRALTCDACHDERKRTLRAGEELLAELLSPFDMSHGAFLEANAALRRANGLLESEAHRIARLLHDSAGQIVFALQLALADVRVELPERHRRRLDELQPLLAQLDQQLRTHAHELYPMVLEDLGLAPALGELIETIRRAGLAIGFRCSLTERLPQDIESALYRAVHEALKNILKHAHATEVRVTVRLAGTTVACSIADNGVGFLPQREGHSGPGLGLAGIRERMKCINGTVRVKSRQGQGAEVILTAPLPGKEQSIGIKRHSG